MGVDRGGGGYVPQIVIVYSQLVELNHFPSRLPFPQAFAYYTAASCVPIPTPNELYTALCLYKLYVCH